MKIECPECGQLIEKKGMHKHVGSKKCLNAQRGVSSGSGGNDAKCPECETDLKILTKSTSIKMPDGRFVAQEEVLQFVGEGYTKYCPRCLEVLK